MKNNNKYTSPKIEIINLLNEDVVLDNSPRFGDPFDETDYLISGIDFWGIF